MSASRLNSARAFVDALETFAPGDAGLVVSASRDGDDQRLCCDAIGTDAGGGIVFGLASHKGRESCRKQGAAHRLASRVLAEVHLLDERRAQLVVPLWEHVAEARRRAKQAGTLLKNAPLARLLLAQTAELEGDKRNSSRHLQALLENPETSFLALRGLKTVHLRVPRMCDNALLLARHLEGRPKVARVLYPGLASHPGHEVARRQMSAFGGVVTFVLEGGLPAAERFYDGLSLIARAASLGGVESLASLPVLTSHHGYSDEELRAAGVDPGMVRLSMGVEDAADLIADVDRALAAV